MSEQRKVYVSGDWTIDALKLFAGPPAPLQLGMPISGLDMPDVELDALCEGILAGLSHESLDSASKAVRSRQRR